MNPVENLKDDEIYIELEDHYDHLYKNYFFKIIEENEHKIEELKTNNQKEDIVKICNAQKATIDLIENFYTFEDLPTDLVKFREKSFKMIENIALNRDLSYGLQNLIDKE